MDIPVPFPVCFFEGTHTQPFTVSETGSVDDSCRPCELKLDGFGKTGPET